MFQSVWYNMYVWPRLYCWPVFKVKAKNARGHFCQRNKGNANSCVWTLLWRGQLCHFHCPCTLCASACTLLGRASSWLRAFVFRIGDPNNGYLRQMPRKKSISMKIRTFCVTFLLIHFEETKNQKSLLPFLSVLSILLLPESVTCHNCILGIFLTKAEDDVDGEVELEEEPPAEEEVAAAVTDEKVKLIIDLSIILFCFCWFFFVFLAFSSGIKVAFCRTKIFKVLYTCPLCSSSSYNDMHISFAWF